MSEPSEPSEPLEPLDLDTTAAAPPPGTPRLGSMGLGALFMFVGQVIYRVLMFGLGILVSRGLGQALLGRFGMLMGVQAFSETLGRAGLPMTNHRFVARCLAAGDNEGVRTTARLTTLLALATSVPLLIIVWFAAPWIADHYYHRPDLTLAFRIGGATVPVTSLLLTMLAVPQAARNTVPYVVVWCIGQPLVFVVGGAVVVWMKGNAQGLIVAYAVSMAVGCLAAGVLLLRWLPKPDGTRESDVNLRSLIRFSATMTLKAISTLVLFSADIWILGRYVSDEALGVYVAASRTAQLIGFPRTAINPLLSPTASDLHTRGDIDGLRRQYVAGTRWTVGASLGIFGIITIAPRLVMLLFGKDFTGGGDLLIILSASWLAQAAFAGSQFVLIMTGGQRIATVTEWIGAALLVAGLPYICSHWGTVGAAWWVFVVIAGVNCAREINLHQRLHIHPFDRKFGWAMLASAVLILPLSYLGMRHGDNLRVSGVLLLVFAVAFSVICWYGWMPELAARLKRKLGCGEPPPTLP